MTSRVFSLKLDAKGFNDCQISDAAGTSASRTCSTPKEVPLFRNCSIRQIACGLQRTVFVLSNGKVYTHNGNQGDVIPELVSSLEKFFIVQAACGDAHSVVLSNKGHVMSWGKDLHGQCGHGTVNIDRPKPRVIHSLSKEFIVQVSCGSGHTLALAKSGKLFAWGDNSSFQLGFNTPEHTLAVPTEIACLTGLPIKQISCGGDHSLALTFSGAVFGWGYNESEQLGKYDEKDAVMPKRKHKGPRAKQSSTQTQQQMLNELLKDSGTKRARDYPASSIEMPEIEYVKEGTTKRNTYVGRETAQTAAAARQKARKESSIVNGVSVTTVPHEIKFLRDQQISYIASGQNHSVFLSLNGKVISFGKNSEDTVDSWSKRCVELTEADKKIICGRLHTLAFIPSSKNLYIFGAKSSDDPKFTLQACHESLSKQYYGNTAVANESAVVNNIYCGGLTCYFVISESLPTIQGSFRQEYTSDRVIYQLDEKSISRLTTVRSQASRKGVAKAISRLFSSSACLNRSFLTSDHYCCSEKNPGLDLDRARKAFETLSRKHTILSQISEVIHKQLSPTLLKSPPGIEALRLYLLLLEFPTMGFPESYLQSIVSITKALCSLTPEMSKVIDSWIGNFPPDRLEHLIAVFKNVIVDLVSKQREKLMFLNFSYEREMTIALDMLKKLYKISEDKEIVPYTSFYIPEANLFSYVLEGTFHPGALRMMMKFFEHPFILENDVKMQLLLFDSQIEKVNTISEEFRKGFLLACMGYMNTEFCPIVVLTINRGDIVGSTLRQLKSQSDEDFKKILQVKFKDEPGVDDGGPMKEFFLLIFQQILDPQFGMFKEFSKSRAIWFNPQEFFLLIFQEILDPQFGMFKEFSQTRKIWFNDQSSKDKSMFRLVGVLCGLVIYNQVIVDMPFPLALYKKLLKRPVHLSDFKELDETMAGCLQDILDYEDFDLQDVFDLYFQVSTECCGEVRIVDLKEGGKNIPVTIDNKQEYVDLYIHYFFNELVKDQYNAFEEGFFQVCDGIKLQRFHPQELIALVVGNNIYDWEEFEQLVEYRGIFSKEHKTIKFFWEVFHDFTLQEKKKFLAFLTGSDRIPVQGMSQLHVRIQPVFGSTDFLPVAQTCYNILELPLYESKEIMQEMLLKALEYGQGFGLFFGCPSTGPNVKVVHWVIVEGDLEAPGGLLEWEPEVGLPTPRSS
ncbi:probable E3 ubiquitin-protein ligase HERC3 [Anneissia japonica]|uniref:probable E3 ubiquitin-protein ligase HERC3 n=1 Tax=Anneissia japonica TaxID=1529436 RepID=UPI001425B581|nr:probable E3 ubiquitin-protein ligase HERC3 [Anneissia japonica]